METTKKLGSGKNLQWMGYVLSALVTLLLVADGLVYLFKPSVSAAEMAATGFPLEQTGVIGAIIFACAIFRFRGLAYWVRFVSQAS